MSRRNRIGRSHHNDGEEHLRRILGFVRNIAGALAAVVTAWRAIAAFQRAEALVTVTHLEQAALVMFVGSVAAGLHGIFWSIAERAFHWPFGAGGGKELPHGASALVLSATLTLSLLIAPALVDFVYEALTSERFLPIQHWLYGWTIVFGGALSHVVMYGFNSYGLRGLRQHLMPTVAHVSIPRALVVEALYAAAHFATIAVPYRFLVSTSSEPLLLRPAIGAALFLILTGGFILARYPASVADPTWVQARGVFSGFVLALTLTGGMLF